MRTLAQRALWYRYINWKGQYVFEVEPDAMKLQQPPAVAELKRRGALFWGTKKTIHNYRIVLMLRTENCFRLILPKPHGCCEQDIERGEQHDGAVTSIVVGLTFGLIRSQRQNRLSTIQRLNLALLVHTQNQRFVRRDRGTSPSHRAT
jgi:hypothetical protein